MNDWLDHIRPWLQNLLHGGQDVAAQAGQVAGQALGTMDMASLAALAGVLGWASGMRLYLVVFLTGLAGAMGWIALPAGLHVLQHPMMLAASGFMLFLEFFVDKIPGLDSVWDIIHSVIRVPAGAALAAGVFGADSATLGMVAGLLGGTLAATSYATKTASRAALNTSPEPFTNIGASLLEEGMVTGGLWLATHHPVAFGVALAIVLVLMVALLIATLKFLKAVIARIRVFLGGTPQPQIL